MSESEEEVDINARKRAWARLLAKVYEVDPFVGPTCAAGTLRTAIVAVIRAESLAAWPLRGGAPR